MAVDWTAGPELADWWVGRLHPFGSDVGSLVPDAFEAFARVLHPTRCGLRWSEIAAENGLVAHPHMQFHAIARSPTHGMTLDLSEWPVEGSLGQDLLSDLVRVLEHNTTTPESCLFAFWEGMEGLEVTSAPSIPQLPGSDRLVRAQKRSYRLARGSLSDVTYLSALFAQQSPHAWWPVDRSWFVATEVDLDSTYIGASRECIDEVLARPNLECFEVELDSGISHGSDIINGAMRPGHR